MQSIEKKLLPKMYLTQAGTGTRVSVTFDEVQNTTPISLPREAYAPHRKPGGATGLQRHEEYYERSNEYDGTVFSIKNKGELTVLQTIDEIREARDAGIDDLHNSPEVLARRDAALRTSIAENNDGPIDILKGFGTHKAKMPGIGRTETVERTPLQIEHDIKNGRPPDGSDSAPALIYVLGKKPPIRLGVGMPDGKFKIG